MQDIVLVRGDYREGSVFSVRGADGQFYEADAVVTAATDQPGSSGPGGFGPGIEVTVPELASADYLIGGNIVDVVAIGQTNINNATSLNINVISGGSEIFTIVFVECYNFRSGQWTLCGVGANGGGSNLNFPVQSPNDHISSTGRMLARVYYVGFPGFGSAFTQTNYTARIDLIDIRPLVGISN